MTDQVKSVVRAIVEDHWNKKNAGLASELFASRCAIHTPDAELHGVEGAGQLFTAYSTAFPDFQMTIDDLIAEGDCAALRYTFSGTHTGPLGPVPASGKRVTTHGISLMRLSGGKVAEARMEWDRVSLRQQIGLLPAD